MIISAGVGALNMLRNSGKVQLIVNHRNFLMKNNHQAKAIFMCTRQFSRGTRAIHQRISPQSSSLLSNQLIRGFRARAAKPPPPKRTSNIWSNQEFVVVLKYGLLTSAFIMTLYGGLGLAQYYKIQRENSLAKFLLGRSSRYHVYFDNEALDTNVTKVRASNIAVYLLWKISSLEKFMNKWFVLSAVQGIRNVPSMLLNGFSHKHFLHLFVNMYVLKSFMDPWKMREQSKTLEGFSRFELFFPFYLSALSFASFISLATKVLTRQAIPSLGASGAIMALLSYACCKYPASQLSLVFLPNWTFSAETGLYAILLFDLIGFSTMIFRSYLSWWSPIDHAGHLGGLLFGIFYAKFLESKLFLPWTKTVRNNWESFMEMEPTSKKDDEV